MALNVGDFLSKYGPRALTVLGFIMEAVPDAVEFVDDLKEHRFNKAKALGIVEKKLEVLGFFSATVENHRESVMLWVNQGIDWAVGGINLVGAAGERIEFDPTPISPEAGEPTAGEPTGGTQ